MPPPDVAVRAADRRSAHPRQTLSRLQAEWEVVATRSTSLAIARSWTFLDLGSPDDLRSLDQVLAVVGFRPTPAAPRPGATPRAVADPAGEERQRNRADGALLALVERAHDDELAARVVLQRLLPGLSAIARRQGRCMADHLQAFDDLLPAAWGVIRNFPAERRRQHVAAALLRDCEYRAFRRERRRMLVLEATPSDQLDRAVELHEVAVEPLAEVLDVVAAAQPRHLVAGDVALLGRLLSGMLVRDAAADLAVSERTVRNHRAAMVHRLRAAIAA